MDIAFDPAKDASNQSKHGVSLALAAMLDWSAVLAGVDSRRDYRELREIGFGIIGARLYCVVFTQRGETMHIISLRKANKREARNYVGQT
ncbi:BrnT family toxin [Cupriavidus respiraculi]|uniref:BrnT family toxin n=1 Tax=Cupriavidus respiraculi TaxID=195930 RepID=UPI001C94FC6A|nr:BrnT family toxin [Cupriavidus respiraculi]MBY4948895.1 BrnT family toxin [Cupriavidus respiraculi]